jgi:hypothetical protein
MKGEGHPAAWYAADLEGFKRVWGELRPVKKGLIL